MTDAQIPIRVKSEFAWYGEQISSRMSGSGAAALVEAASKVAALASQHTYDTFNRQTGFAGSNWGYIVEGYGSQTSVVVGSFNNPPDIVNKYGAHRQANYVVWLNEGWTGRGGGHHKGGKMLQKARDEVAPQIGYIWKQKWEGWGTDDFGKGTGRVRTPAMTGQVAFVPQGGGIDIGDF